MSIPKTLINQAKVDGSQVNFVSMFNRDLQAVEDPMRAIAMETSSSGSSEDLNWLGTVPGLTEWIDQRRISQLRAENITIVNKDFASGFEVNRNDILDDKLGNITPKIAQLSQKAGLHYGQLIVEAMVAGFSAASVFGTAYDGAAFFSAAHQDGGEDPIQSNTAGGAALGSVAYFAARAAMWSLTDNAGDPLGIVPDTLVIGPSLEEVGRELTQAPLKSGGESNVAANTASLMISPRLIGPSASHWFLISLRDIVRPMILQIREAIFADFLSDGELEFRTKKLEFGAQGRHAVAYGLWQYAHGSDA